MDYTVKQLSNLAGVSVRTLHFYDEIGLLRPTRVGANGYRYYGDAAVLRLQQILFYKELGLSLDEIAEVLDQPDFDVVRALEAHRRALQQRLGRLRHLMKTVDRTIAHLKGDTTMDTKELFAGLSDEQQAQYEQEAEALWGETVRESSRKWKAYSPAQKARIMAEGQAVYQDLLDQLDEPPASRAVQAIIARWHQHLRYFFEPSADVLRGLGQGYNDNPQFNATFQRLDPKLAPFMRAAIEVYCDKLEPGA
jgi:DNA-binding transcriptional MerR regulator